MIRSLVNNALRALLLCWVASVGAQEEYPSHPVQVVVPFAAGGTFDIAMRILQPALSEELGVPVVVVNRVGGGGIVGTGAVANAKPDGYTLAATASSTISLVQVTMRESVRYSVGDFIPLGNYASDVSGLVVPKGSGFDTAEKLFAAIRQKPNNLSVANSGTGGVSALAALSAKKTLDLKWTDVPFSGSSGVNSALLGRQVDAGVVALASTTSLIDSGSMKLLAVTGSKRLERFPNVPTFSELGIQSQGLDFRLGLYAPKGVPPKVTNRLAAALKKVAADTKTQQALKTAGLVPLFEDQDAALRGLAAMYSMAKGLYGETASGAGSEPKR